MPGRAPLVVGDHLRRLWRNGMRDMEIMRIEVYTGSNIVLAANSVLHHVQLKSGRSTAAHWIANRRRHQGSVFRLRD